MIRLATDVGGTFTDLVAYDEHTGAVFTAKALTTTQDPAVGVLDTIAAAGRSHGLRPTDVGFFAHGGTTVINAITERKGVKTALVTTHGFRDVLEIGRGTRPDLYNLCFESPVPFVPRHLRFEVRERLDAHGAVIEPLQLSDLDAIVAACRRERVEAIGVVFLHSYANPEHERLCSEALAQALPDVTVCASHEISRQWREYERSNTVVLNAYVQPLIARYFRALEHSLDDAGIRCQLHAMQSNGGIATFDQAARRPLTLVESGPAGGVAGAVRVAAALGVADILYLDVGGTTAKCSLIQGARPTLNVDYKLERTRLQPGYPVQVPVVDIVEIGAGGGSIAWIDARGGLRVGPESAGSTPGPACYGRGGTRPTVTDAILATGVFDPDRFADGTLRLDRAAARAAMAPIAAHLDTSLEQAALSIIAIAEANMINALKLVTVQRGHDPRDLALVVSGGAGPALAARLGREMGARSTVIPPHPGIFSAWGMLAARPRVDFRTTWFSALDAAALDAIERLFDTLEASATAYFDEGAATRVRFAHGVEARYRGAGACRVRDLRPRRHACSLRRPFSCRPRQGLFVPPRRGRGRGHHLASGSHAGGFGDRASGPVRRRTIPRRGAARGTPGLSRLGDRLAALPRLRPAAPADRHRHRRAAPRGRTDGDHPRAGRAGPDAGTDRQSRHSRRPPRKRAGAALMAIAITIESVSRAFGALMALESVDLTIEAGAFFTLLGSSGSGKSTLLKIIGGFDRPTSGRVCFDGVDVSAVPADRRPVNTVFQDLALFPHMSVGQNVGYGLRLRRLPRQDIARRVADALALVALKGFEDRRVTLLSGGQRQRVALARALIMEPGVLLLDEPLTGLDERLRQQMRDEFGRLHKKTGATFILVTHNQDEALSLSDRMAVMHQGRIEQVDAPARFFEAPANTFVARFVGIDAILRPERIVRQGATALVMIAGQRLPVATSAGGAGADAVALRPDRLKLLAADETAPCVLDLTVASSAYRGLSIELRLAFADGQTMTLAVPADAETPMPQQGDRVRIGVAPHAAALTTTFQSSDGASSEA